MENGVEHVCENVLRKIRTCEVDDYLYLDVELEFPVSPQSPLDESAFRLLILTSIDTLFGESGYKIVFDILKYRDRPQPRAYLRVQAREYVKLRIALSLVSELGGSFATKQGGDALEGDKVRCQFTIHKV